jgi:aminotransferase
MERADLEAIAAVLRDTNILVISDEIYAELTFGDASHVSIASIDGMKERTVLINGFSKTFSMTGWRLGYACGPAPVMEQLTKIHQYAIMCAPTTSQYAAIEALRHGDEAVAAMREEYDMRRRLIVNGFNKLGLECFEPKGAFYAFPSIKSTGLSSEEFCERLLYSKKVAIVPGNAFGESGEGHVRASYCYSVDHIREALRRIGEFLEEIK